MDTSEVSGTAARFRRSKSETSYKFQRLRERVRQAIASGELAGKLPGERALARRFHVNAKTLSKALTDLAAEGLLDRSIGRGTYVKGSAAAPAVETQRWMIVGQNARQDSTLVRLLMQAHPESEIVPDVSSLRPSFLKQFEVVVDLGPDTPEAFLRDMVVRNMTVVALNREPSIYSVNLVGPDRSLGASLAVRDLLFGGHRRIALVQSTLDGNVAQTVQKTVQRLAADASVELYASNQAVQAVRNGATAILCVSTHTGCDVRRMLHDEQIRVPDDVSVVAVGCMDECNSNTGYFVDCGLMVETVKRMVAEANVVRPAALWLAPQLVDRATTRVLPATIVEQRAA